MHSCLLIASCLVIVASAAPQQRLQWQRLIDASREEGGEEEDQRIKFPSLAELDEEWRSFKSKYGKTYDEEEEMTRKGIFANHVKAMIKHNYLYKKGLKSFTMGINQFSDLGHSEFVKTMTCYKPSKLSERSNGSTFLTPEVNSRPTLPSVFDWREKGAVNKVQNQCGCGSCWAFSAVGSLEGQHFKRTGKLVSLSAQQLVDCSTTFRNQGCCGGNPEKAFEYIKSIKGLQTERSYRYTAKDGYCLYNTALAEATCSGYTSVATGSELKLQEAVTDVGPVSVAIDASQPSFQYYEKGVYNEPKCSSTALNHAVLVVGYGTSQADGDYWIVKNSYGYEWGMDGYIWMSRNKNNQCGIATNALYPVI